MKLAAGLQSHTTTAAISSGSEASDGFLRYRAPDDFRVVILRNEDCHRRVDHSRADALMRMPLSATHCGNSTTKLPFLKLGCGSSAPCLSARAGQTSAPSPGCAS